MLDSSAREIEAHLRGSDLVLDVGGWAKPFVRADWVLDVLPYETRAPFGHQGGEAADERFSRSTWVSRDICDREPWPFEDRQFDFAICSHTLEDLRDPIRVCSELVRVARAGYIEVPSRVEELTWRMQGEWAGWSHHRWLVDVRPGRLDFVFKTHAIHGSELFHFPDGYCNELNAEERAQTFWWEGGFEATEVFLIGADDHDAYMGNLVTRQLRERPHRDPPARSWLQRLWRAVRR